MLTAEACIRAITETLVKGVSSWQKITVRKKNSCLKEKDKAKKQMVLRLSPTLWNEIAAWAEEDFRSINGQVEYLLSECVRKRKGG